LPSGNAVAARVLLRLHHISGEPGLRDRAQEILRLYHQEAAQNPFGYAAYLEALELHLQGPTEVVVVSPTRVAADPLWTAVARVYLPHRVLVAARPDDPTPLPVARDRPAVAGRPTAYVCRNFACSAPVSDPEALRSLLESGSRATP
jgi:uncharacterized protein YyaL (SSP411 family)